VLTISLLSAVAPGCRLTVPGSPQRDAAADAAAHPDAAVGVDAAPSPDAAAQADAAAQVDAAPPDAGPPPHTCQPTASQDCSPGSGQATAEQCGDGTSCYLSNVQSAVNGTISAHPEWFSWDDQIPCWIILDVDNFLNAVVAHLQGQGLCVIRDPNAYNEEITVKHDNAFAESFDIVASTGCARSGGGIYTGYCGPAWW
jgi:hypothetical protein